MTDCPFRPFPLCILTLSPSLNGIDYNIFILLWLGNLAVPTNPFTSNHNSTNSSSLPLPLSHSILIYTTTPNHSLTPLLGYYHSVRFALWWSLLKGNPYMIWYIPSSVGFDLSSLHLRPFPLTINRHGERWILKREKKPFFIFVFYFYCSTSTFKGSLCFFYFFNLIHLAILSVRSFPFGFVLYWVELYANCTSTTML